MWWGVGCTAPLLEDHNLSGRFARFNTRKFCRWAGLAFQIAVESISALSVMQK